MNPQTTQKRWASICATATFVVGSACLLVFFVLQPTSGWGPPLLLIYGPLLFGLGGIAFSILSRHWLLAVLNTLPPLAFPAMMFFGTMLFGP